MFKSYTVEKEHVNIDGEESIPALVLRPIGIASPLAIINLHGQGGNVSKENALEWMMRTAAMGVAVVGIDNRLHGERRSEHVDLNKVAPVLTVYNIVEGTAGDVVTVLDYLLARPHLCNGRVALRGFSLGALIALVAAARRQEFDPLLIVAVPARCDSDTTHFPSSKPDPGELRRIVEQIDPFMRLHAYPPRRIMFMHGEHDEAVSYEDALRLYKALAPVYAADAPEKLAFLFYPGAHHPPAALQSLGWRWLAEQLLEEP